KKRVGPRIGRLAALVDQGRDGRGRGLPPVGAQGVGQPPLIFGQWIKVRRALQRVAGRRPLLEREEGPATRKQRRRKIWERPRRGLRELQRARRLAGLEAV